MTTNLVKYPKVRRLGCPETMGILDGPVEVSEKLDGANGRLCRNSKREIVMGSRNHSQASFGQEFNGGFGKWVHENQSTIHAVFDMADETFPNERVILVGEFMRKHAINYEIDEPYFILYDIMFEQETEDGKYAVFVPDDIRNALLTRISLTEMRVNLPLATGTFTYDELADQFMNKPSQLNPNVVSEGIVIKSSEYRNQYGRQCHAKMVNEAFVEKSKSKAKQSKTSIDYTALVEQYVTPARIQKLLNTKNAVPDVREMKWLATAVSEDIVSEEILEIMQSVNVLDFRVFNKQCAMRTVRILQELMIQNV